MRFFFSGGRVIPLSHRPIVPSSHRPFLNFYALLMLFYAVIMQKIAKVICGINNFYYFCVMICCRVIALPMPTNHLLNNETLFSNHINKQFFMKKFFSFMKAFVGCAVVVTMLATSVVSCQYDDTELRGEIDNIKKELAQLRVDVQSQLDALKALVEGQVTVKGVVTNQDGSTTITLSNDKTITVYPEVSIDGQITIVEQEGVKYWAQYNAEGEAVLISIGGNNIPVSGIAPETRVNEETNAIEVSFDGGNTWVETGTSTGIAKAEIVYSTWQVDEEENPLALYCKIVMADGTEINVPLAGNKIALPKGDALYAAPGTTSMAYVVALMHGATDWMFQLPAGWDVEIEYNAEFGEAYINATAPSAQAIASGVAAEAGTAKMLVTFENGTSAIASFYLSSTPAKLALTPDGISVSVYPGVEMLIFGLSKAGEYSAEAAAEAIQGFWYGMPVENAAMLQFWNGPDGYMGWNEFLSEELVAGEQYVVWYYSPIYDNYYNMILDSAYIGVVNYRHMEVSFEVTAQNLFNVEVDFSVVGSNGFRADWEVADEWTPAFQAAWATENNYYFSDSYYLEFDGEYEGNICRLFNSYNSADGLMPGTDYVFWMINANDSLVFAEGDVLYWEFATKNYETSGGTVTMEVNEEGTYNDYTQMTVQIDMSAQPSFVLYKYVPKFEASRYATDEDIIALLTEDFVDNIIKSPADQVWCSASQWNLEGKPGDEFTLFAVAADADGKLGTPIKYDYCYKAIEYNSLVPAVTVSDTNVDKVVVDVECADAMRILYFITATDEDKWKEECGGTAEGASAFIALNTDSPYTVFQSDNNTAASYEDHKFENDQIIYTGAYPDKEHVVVVAAMDENWKVSKAVVKFFTPTMNLGEVVYKTDAEWEANKPEVSIYSIEKVSDFTPFEWTVAPKEGFIAYSIGEHVDNFAYNGVDTTDVKAMIAYIAKHEDVIECEYSADGYFYDAWDDTTGEYIGLQEYPGVLCDVFYGTEGKMQIWTTWRDAEGNYYEPFMVEVK